MPNRRVVTKKRSTALIRQQIEWAVYDMADVTPLPYCAKSRQSLIIFSAMLRVRRGRKPPVDDSVAVYPFARRRNFMHFASHDRIFTIGFLLPSSASSRWFYSEILHNPTFLYKLSLNKIIINQVRVGLHGGFSVLSSNNFDIQSVTKALRRSVKAHLFCSSPGMDMASLHDHIKYNWISARKRIKTGTYLCIWNIFDFSLAQKSVKCFFRKNR